MTLGQESSDRARNPNPPARIESLAGAFHPHAIEVQDFSHYALIIDVRTREDYEDDHIPGAVQFSPAVVSPGPLVTGQHNDRNRALAAHDSGPEAELPASLAALVEPLKLDQAILVYCGRGGLDSLPVARALRWRGWSVDVLPGGWINYRRWVQAGLEVLPRMVTFRVVATSLGCEADRVLNALATVGHQVLNVEALMVRRRGSISCRCAQQPSQTWFESQLLQRLRAVDPRRPVWVGDVDAQVGELQLPGSLADALVAAPAAPLGAPIEERVNRWIEDEPAWASPSDAVDAIASWEPAPERHLLDRWRELSLRELAGLVASVLTDYLDRRQAARLSQRMAMSSGIAPLVADSLNPDRLAPTVRAWQPTPDAVAT
ncbi:rhodanese-like domain-containing protein [Methylibium sp.]|jgi:tRNA 2-selenouridine synthase|uniref:rhodanese-like domain-containing protein n=1 Tax=Methylibium sp. TaxID=2067992 RepID=UPI003D13AF3D